MRRNARIFLGAFVSAVAMVSTAARAQTPNCKNLLALHFARSAGLADCDGALYAAPGNACDGLTANDCAELMLTDPPPPVPAAGNLEYAYTWLCPAADPGCADAERAKCVDGSRPSFFHHLPAAPSTDWIFYMTGGGGCIGDDCATKYPTGEGGEMSTCHGGNGCVQSGQATFGDHSKGSGILGSNPAKNRFAGWNRVSMRKCTYDAFRGDAIEVGIVDGPDVVDEVFHHGNRHLKHTFNQLAAGTLPRSLADATRIVVVGNSGGGKSLILTGDELREHLAGLAPAAEIRFVVDAHDLPMIQTEALLNPTHAPAPPAAATNVYEVPWGGSGTLPVGDTGTQPPYDEHMFAPTPAPPGIAWQYNTAWGARMDASCQTTHGTDAPPCHDEMHVLWNHVTTPFFISMSLGDSVWRDGGAIFSESPYDWNDQDFANRIYTQTEHLLDFYATMSELATGEDASGTSGSDPNDLQPAWWERAVFLPDCSGGGSHTPLINDDQFSENGVRRCLGPSCNTYDVETVLGEWLDFGLARTAMDGYVEPSGWTWGGSTCANGPCVVNGICDVPLESACSCPVDCGAPTAVEANCNDGYDDDCDGKPDCADDDCPACACTDDGDCDDANACTEDRCVSGSCTHTPSSAAGPLGSLVMLENDTGTVTVGWDTVPIADSYNTYRGNLVGGVYGSDHVCFEKGDEALDGPTTSTDTDPPLPGDGHYYLVSTVDACGESSLGRSSAGVERSPGTACP